MSLTLTLLPEEEDMAKAYAKAVQAAHETMGNLRDGIMDPYLATYRGACAEIIVGRAYDQPWLGKVHRTEAEWKAGRFTTSDAGLLEVRMTPNSDGRLYCTKLDKDDAPYVLVRLHEYPRCHIMGWAFGADVKKKEYWWDPGYGKPNYYLPMNRLRSVQELQDYIDQHDATQK